MASPMVDGRVEPHRKATYTLEVSEQIRREGRAGGGFSGVKYNHKPTLSSGTRTTTLQPSTSNTFDLSLRDTSPNGDTDIFVFNGTRTAPPKSYVLLFDQTTQKASLERLDSTYTFNLCTRNSTDVSSEHSKIYPRKLHKDSVHDKDSSEEDLFGAVQGEENEDVDKEADAANPYDFRHFLHGVKSKKDAEERGYASSPESRSNTGVGHVSLNANASVSAHVPPARRAVDQGAKKRKTASVFAPRGKKAAPSAIRGTERSVGATVNSKPTSTSRPVPTSSRAPAAAAAGTASGGRKIKSAEFVQSSDESDVDIDADINAEGEANSTLASPKRNDTRRSPSPGHRDDDDEDAEGEDDDEEDEEGYGDGELEIQVPDAPRSSYHLNHRNKHTNHLTAGVASPSNHNRPISLASAANSVQGTPRRGMQAEEIDFGDLNEHDDSEDAEGEEDFADGDADEFEREEQDRNVGVHVDLHTRHERNSVSTSAAANGSAGAVGSGHGAATAEVDEDDPLYMEMMEGLAGGDSSEESEEE